MKSSGSPDLLNQLIEQLADLVADRVVQRLGQVSDGFVDQTTSPLGNRRHIDAIRTGKLKGRQVGRKYLARSTDVDAYVRSSSDPKDSGLNETDDVDKLAEEFGFRKQGDR